MRFSVIVPIYQVEKYLAQCIESVLRQTFTDFELILVDDGSTDGSAAIAERYAQNDERVRLQRQPNGGLSAARDTGIRAARGEYLIFLDSDDYWLTRFGLEEIDHRLSGFSPDAVFWLHRKVAESENAFSDEPTAAFSAEVCALPHGAVPYIKSKRLIVCAWDMAIRRSLFDDGSLDFEEGVFSEDVEWVARLLLRMKRCVFTDMALNAYRLRDGSITKNVKEKNLADLNRHYHRIAGYIAETDPDTAAMLKTYLGEQAANYILALVLSEPQTAERYKRCEAFPFLRCCVTKRAKALKWMKRLLGVGATVFLIKKLTRR